VYAPGKSKVLHTISKAVNVPAALAFDSGGNLYVANSSSSEGTVTVYSFKLSLIRTISQGVADPVAIAVDTHGLLSVANFFAGSVTQYAPGSKTVARKLTNGINMPISLVFGP
jgi:DNA-binding beta-propeller fold protein YncE